MEAPAPSAPDTTKKLVPLLKERKVAINSVAFVTKYMEQRKWLTGAVESRKIHPLAAWIFLNLHTDANKTGTADNGKADAILFRLADALENLRVTLQAEVIDVSAFVVQYKNLTDVSTDVFNREMTLVRVVAAYRKGDLEAKQNIEPFTYSAVGDTVESILKQSKLTGDNSKNEIFNPFVTTFGTDGMFVDWKDTFKETKVSKSWAGLGGTALFDDNAKKIQEPLDLSSFTW